MEKRIKILETPRDAMQGMSKIISTTQKVELYQALLNVNFDVLDIGSFVNSEIIPQFADMDRVLRLIDKSSSSTQLFVLAANEKGASLASDYQNIDVIGFPFSTSETFLKKNINASIDEGWQRIYRINEICNKSNKQMMVYLAMAFGNPYGDETSIDLLLEFTEKLAGVGIDQISLSDIIGVASPKFISNTYKILSNEFPEISFGLHLHINPSETLWLEKLQAAYFAGCIRFDGVINGLGGCPMTGFELLGNLSTEHILNFAQTNGLLHELNLNNFQLAKGIANTILTVEVDVLKTTKHHI